MKKPKKANILTSQFDYHLPQNLIAQEPTKPRDHARLLILDKKTKKIQHKKFYDIVDYLNPGDVLVLNNSKVIPARLIGKKETGGRIEIFLLNKITKAKKNKTNFKTPLYLPLKRGEANIWNCLIGGKTKVGDKIYFTKKIVGEITSKDTINRVSIVQFNCSDKKLFSIGQTPTPPYIKSKDGTPVRLSRPGGRSVSTVSTDYQTVYAKTAGSVAAPTAGLHFTKRLINKLKKQGIKFEYITLHVGLGTFSPVKSKYIEDHQIHSEYAVLNQATAKRLNQAKKRGNKIIAVGTTSVRTLETFSNIEGDQTFGHLHAENKWVDIFIYPEYKFKFVDSIITNFHLPKSSLIMLVSAFTQDVETRARPVSVDGIKTIKSIYTEAIKKKYKFYSFGDAMLIK